MEVHENQSLDQNLRMLARLIKRYNGNNEIKRQILDVFTIRMLDPACLEALLLDCLILINTESLHCDVFRHLSQYFIDDLAMRLYKVIYCTRDKDVLDFSDFSIDEVVLMSSMGFDNLDSILELLRSEDPDINQGKDVGLGNLHIVERVSYLIHQIMLEEKRVSLELRPKWMTCTGTNTGSARHNNTTRLLDMLSIIFFEKIAREKSLKGKFHESLKGKFYDMLIPQPSQLMNADGMPILDCNKIDRLLGDTSNNCPYLLFILETLESKYFDEIVCNSIGESASTEEHCAFNKSLYKHLMKIALYHYIAPTKCIVQIKKFLKKCCLGLPENNDIKDAIIASLGEKIHNYLEADVGIRNFRKKFHYQIVDAMIKESKVMEILNKDHSAMGYLYRLSILRELLANDKKNEEEMSEDELRSAILLIIFKNPVLKGIFENHERVVADRPKNLIVLYTLTDTRDYLLSLGKTCEASEHRVVKRAMMLS